MAELVGSGFMEKKAPIHYAIEMDSDRIVDLLCQHYPQCVNHIYYLSRNNTTEYERKSPLIFAIEKKNYRMCESILNSPYIDVNFERYEFYKIRNRDKIFARRGTALHFAFLSHCEDIIRLLLQNRQVDVNALYVKEYIFNDDERRKQIKTSLYMAHRYARDIEYLLLDFPIVENGLNLLDIGGGTNLLGNNESIQDIDFKSIIGAYKNFFHFWDSFLSKAINRRGVVTNDSCFEYKVFRSDIDQNQIQNLYNELHQERLRNLNIDPMMNENIAW